MFIKNIKPMYIEKPKPSDIIFKQSFTRKQLFKQEEEKDLFKCQELAKPTQCHRIVF